MFLTIQMRNNLLKLLIENLVNNFQVNNKFGFVRLKVIIIFNKFE